MTGKSFQDIAKELAKVVDSPGMREIRAHRKDMERALGALYPIQKQLNALPSFQLTKQLQETVGAYRSLYDSYNGTGLRFARQLQEMYRQWEGILGHSSALIAQVSKSTESMQKTLESYRAWVENNKTSYLYEFLAAGTGKSSEIIEQLSQAAEPQDVNGSSECGGQAELVNIKPDLEKKIVAAFQSGGSVKELPKEQREYLKSFWARLWDALEKFSVVLTLLAFFNADTELEKASTPQQVKEVVAKFTPEHRELLAGHSVVKGDDVIVRQGPSTKSKELERLRAKTWVENLGGDTSQWTHVAVEVGGEKIEGWIHRRNLLEF